MTRASRKSSRSTGEDKQGNRPEGSGKFANKDQFTHALNTMESVLRISALLKEVAALMKDHVLMDDGVRMQVAQLQTRVQFAILSNEAVPPLPKKLPMMWVDRRDPGMTPVAYVQQYFGPWMRKGLTLNYLSKGDPAWYQAFFQYRSKGGPIPDDFYLPTKEEWLSAQVDLVADWPGDAESAMRNALRIYQAANRRLSKQKNAAPPTRRPRFERS